MDFPKKIAVLTSGGDAPGMNAAIRSVVRSALYRNMEVYVIYQGYEGMIGDQIVRVHASFVANIIQRGGTVLKTARSEAFKTKQGRQQAHKNIRDKNIEALVVIGGDGTFRGAKFFYEEFGIPCIGIPATIDKDIAGTEYTIGFDTALNTAMEAIDKIRDTAESHDRLFIVEVMGRDAGYIALYSGLATGAMDMFIPERSTDVDILVQRMLDKQQRKKDVRIIVVSEGARIGQEQGARAVEKILQSAIPHFDIKVAILGHMQRGGSPTAMDRNVAGRMGYTAVEALVEGHTNVNVGLQKGAIVLNPFSDKIHLVTREDACFQYLRLARVLSC